MQSRNQFVLPPMSRERSLQVLIGEDRTSRSSDCFSVLASLSVHRFDLALHMMSFPYCILKKKLIIKKKRVGGRICRIFFSLGILDIVCVFT
jgi:hypothetical protein